MATCPECDAEIEIDEDDLEEMEVGDPWDCDACGSRLRVTTIAPLDFEDDDDEDDDDDDDEDEEKKSDDDAEEDDGVDDLDEDDDADDGEEWDK